MGAVPLLGPVLHVGERLDDARSGDDGALGLLRHGAVGHDPVEIEPEPDAATGGGAHLVPLGLADDDPVHLARERGGGERLRAEHQSFLVAQHADDDTAREGTGELKGPHRVDHGRDTGLHVGGAAPPQSAVADLRAVGIDAPVPRLPFRDDVDMALEHQGRPVAASALDDGDGVGSSRRDLHHVVRPAELGEEPGDEVGRGLLDHGGSGRVDGTQPDQVLGEGDDGGGVDGRVGDGSTWGT